MRNFVPPMQWYQVGVQVSGYFELAVHARDEEDAHREAREDVAPCPIGNAEDFACRVVSCKQELRKGEGEQT